MTHERNWVQETIEIRVIIDGILRDQTATDTDLKGLCELVNRITEAHSTRINELADQVQALRSLSFLGAGFALGCVLLAFGWWAVS